MNAARTARQRGIALLVVLLAVALIGLVAGHSLQLGTREARRDAEEELLHVGRAFRQALRSYVEASPGHAALGPRTLDELLRDPRMPGLRRHLRRVPPDPLTGRDEWGLQRSPDGQITGIYSLGDGVPIKRTGFDRDLVGFDDAASYRAWVFTPHRQARR